MKNTLIAAASGIILAGGVLVPVVPVSLVCPAAHVDAVYDTPSGDFDPTVNYLAGQTSFLVTGSSTSTVATTSLVLATPVGTSTRAEAFCNDHGIVRKVLITSSDYKMLAASNAPVLSKSVNQSLLQSAVIPSL